MNDSQDCLDQARAQIVRVMRIIVAALAIGAILFLGITFIVKAGGNQLPRDRFVLTPLGLAVAAGALVGAAVVPNLVVRRFRQQAAAGTWPPREAMTSFKLPPADAKEAAQVEELVRWGSLYQMSLIVRCALIEGAIYFQCAVAFVEHNWISQATALGLVVVLLLQWPSGERLDAWAEAQRDAAAIGRG